MFVFSGVWCILSDGSQKMLGSCVCWLRTVPLTIDIIAGSDLTVLTCLDVHMK